MHDFNLEFPTSAQKMAGTLAETSARTSAWTSAQTSAWTLARTLAQTSANTNFASVQCCSIGNGCKFVFIQCCSIDLTYLYSKTAILLLYNAVELDTAACFTYSYSKIAILRPFPIKQHCKDAKLLFYYIKR